MSTITSLAPWFGSKRTMAPAIVAELGPHSVYWEIFSGSMAVLLNKPPCRTEVVNDLHGDLTNLAWVIQHPRLGPALYRRLRRVLCCEGLFRAALAEVRTPREFTGEPDVNRAFSYFVASWQGMNGVAGTSTNNTNFARRFSSLGGDPAVRWNNAVRSIPAWRKRLEGLQILRSDGIDLAGKIEDRKGTAIFVDPPYLVKGAKYLHDFTVKDHARLAKYLRRFRHTRVVLSYYEHPWLSRLYPGWSVRHIDVAKSLVNQGKRDRTGATRAPEVLLVNRALMGSDTLF